MCDKDHFAESVVEYEARGLVTRRQFGVLLAAGAARQKTLRQPECPFGMKYINITNQRTLIAQRRIQSLAHKVGEAGLILCVQLGRHTREYCKHGNGFLSWETRGINYSFENLSRSLGALLVIDKKCNNLVRE